jgi:predicted nucleotidyltransferase
VTDFRAMLEMLAGAGADFIVVGGLAAVAHGSARLTQDVDIVYAREPQNLDRLVAALGEHRPYLRGAPPGLPFRLDRATLERGLNFTLETDLGDLDLLGEIVGGGRYEDLLDATVTLEVFGHSVRCLALPALVAVKRAAGRPKDIEAIAELEALMREAGEGDTDPTP